MASVRRTRLGNERDRLADARANEEILTEIRDRNAARTVADHASDAEDCRELLAMLGLAADYREEEEAQNAAPLTERDRASYYDQIRRS